MTVTTKFSEDNKKVSIVIEGRFDFGLHQKFRTSYSDATQTGTTFYLDLSQATHIDSSALGMILLLKDHVHNIDGEMSIQHPQDNVYKILEIAQFHRLFKIER